MTSDKAEILTEAEVNEVERSALACDPIPHDLLRYLSTIRQMAGLMERFANLYSYDIEFVSLPFCCDMCEAKKDAQNLLARYKGERNGN